MTTLALSSTAYTAIIAAVALIGGLLILASKRKRGVARFAIVLLGLTLIFAPINIDLTVARYQRTPESIKTACVPTTVLLLILGEPDGFAYPRVFDRYHKAPPRHKPWRWQQWMWARWCRGQVEHGTPENAYRAVQICCTLADEIQYAHDTLQQAANHDDPAVAQLARDCLGFTPTNASN